MPRCGPSEADRQLIAELDHHEVEVSYTQLERWRSGGWIPRNKRTGLGQGRGSRSEYELATLDLVAAIASVARPGRRGSDIVAEVFMTCRGAPTPTGRPHPPPPEIAVRRSLGEVLARRWSFTTAEQKADAVFASAERVASRQPAWHPFLIDDLRSEIHDVPAPSRRTEVKRSRAALQQLLVATALPTEGDAQLLLESFSDLGLLPAEAIEPLLAKTMEDARLHAVLTREFVVAMPSTPRMQEAIRSSPFVEIDRARRLVMAGSSLGSFAALVSLTHPDDPFVSAARPLRPWSTSLSPRPLDLVPGLAALLANADSMDAIEELVSQALSALQGRAEQVIGQQISELQRLANM